MESIFRLVVNYGQSLKQMIVAGHYGYGHSEWRDDDLIIKYFSTGGGGIAELEAHYFHFGREISSRDAVNEIEWADRKNPWTPARIEPLLSLGATFPDEQLQYPIAGLGSIVRCPFYRYVPVLSKDGSCRTLYAVRWNNWIHVSSPFFNRWVGKWASNCRFLATRRISA